MHNEMNLFLQITIKYVHYVDVNQDFQTSIFKRQPLVDEFVNVIACYVYAAWMC